MKSRILKALVLLVSASLAGAYIWRASNKDIQPVGPTAPVPPAGANVVVTDEEVAAMRDSLMSSSKSGIIASEEDIRKMLEEAKRAGNKDDEAAEPNELLPSTKNPGRAVDREDVEKLLGERPAPEVPEEP